MAVVETVERVTKIMDGKPCEVVMTRRVGLDTYIDADGKSFLADEALFADFGEKLGIRKSYILHPAVEPTQEEREQNRRNIQRVAAQAMRDQGLW